jgi:hypothetical protein
MAGDKKIKIEKFDGKDFSWWKMHVEDLLIEKELDKALEEKPEEMTEAVWKDLDKKARATIRLTLTKEVAYNILKETTAKGIMDSLSSMYEKPSAANKIFLIRELVNMRMGEGDSVTNHINNINSILSRLESVGIKFDDEVQALLLLSSLPDSWSGAVTGVSSSVGTDKFTFISIRDFILGESARRKNQGESGKSEMLNVGRGRRNNRSSGSRGRSSSRTRGDVTCWGCNKVGHFKSQCPDKNLNTVAGNAYDDDALILSVDGGVDSWVMDSGASFHAMHSGETMVNRKDGDFGKVRIANGRFLKVTGMGDVNLKTPMGTTWNLKNVRVIPGLKTKLISVGQLDEQGMEVKFGCGKWKVINGNLVVARGKKRGSLYMTEVPRAGRRMTVSSKHDKVWFAKSSAKRVRFANTKPGATQMSAERVRRLKPVRGSGNSGSTGRVPGTVKDRRWVSKASIPTGKFSPVGSLLSLESVVDNPWCISGAGSSCKPVETKDESVMVTVTTESMKTDVLKHMGASTGLQVN